MIITVKYLKTLCKDILVILVDVTVFCILHFICISIPNFRKTILKIVHFKSVTVCNCNISIKIRDPMRTVENNMAATDINTWDIYPFSSRSSLLRTKYKIKKWIPICRTIIFWLLPVFSSSFYKAVRTSCISRDLCNVETLFPLQFCEIWLPVFQCDQKLPKVCLYF